MRLFFQKYARLCIISFIIGVPIVCCGSFFVWSVVDSTPAAFPDDYPGAVVQIIDEQRGSGSGGRWTATTKTYTVTADLLQVQAFYLRQLEHVCQQETVRSFQQTSDTTYTTTCSIKGWTYISPEQREYVRTHPTSQEALDLVYQESHKTSQSITVQLTIIEPTQTAVEVQEFFNAR